MQKRVGKGGKLFKCHKFRTMIASPQPSPEGKGATGWSTVSVAGDSRITPLGAKLRHYKLVYCLLFTVYGLEFTVYGLLFMVYCLRFTVYSLLFY